MSETRTVRLGDVVSFISGGTPSKSKPEYWGGTIPWISGADISESGDITHRLTVTELGIQKSSTNVIQPNSLLLVTRTSVGKVGVIKTPTAISQDITGITPGPEVDINYLRHYLLEKSYFLKMQSRGATIKGVTRDDIARLQIELPQIEVQQRIALSKDIQEQIQKKRERQQELFKELKSAVFHDLFGAYNENMVKLGEVADITSGITKGRKTSQATREVPYLAVANVQAGSLKLDNVKTIEATEAEIEKYRLQKGDLVLTEGGDPDKLGRGAVWNDELPEVIHQNHIFRVRLHADSGLTAEFLEAYLSDSRARRYFLRNAKQTTGIASINKKQLELLPVLRATRNIDIFQKIYKNL